MDWCLLSTIVFVLYFTDQSLCEKSLIILGHGHGGHHGPTIVKTGKKRNKQTIIVAGHEHGHGGHHGGHHGGADDFQHGGWGWDEYGLYSDPAGHAGAGHAGLAHIHPIIVTKGKKGRKANTLILAEAHGGHHGGHGGHGHHHHGPIIIKTGKKKRGQVIIIGGHKADDHGGGGGGGHGHGGGDGGGGHKGGDGGGGHKDGGDQTSFEYDYGWYSHGYDAYGTIANDPLAFDYGWY